MDVSLFVYIFTVFHVQEWNLLKSNQRSFVGNPRSEAIKAIYSIAKRILFKLSNIPNNRNQSYNT